MSKQQDKILLVGAGPMAIEYARVLKAMNLPFITVGRGQQSATKFKSEIGLEALTGGIDKWLDVTNYLPNTAIVSVDEKSLGSVARLLLNKGIKKILVEKPGGFDFDDIKSMASLAKQKNAQVLVAYNRRLYQSVVKAQQLIKAEGGPMSFNFEFTEWGHTIPEERKRSKVTHEWFLGNSTHVIDLAFYIGGQPEIMKCFTAGHLSWHPKAAVFSGAGISKTGALFSYHANWQSAGRWGVEILTKKNKYIFRPLEKLQVLPIASIKQELVDLDYSIDEKFKPGIYLQVDKFLNNPTELLPIDKQIDHLNYYQAMLKGEPYPTDQ